MKMIDDVIIIGIDSGYGNIKTANCCFPASVSAYDKEPVFKENLLVYESKFYLIGEGHKEFLADKTKDLDYYVLALAAIARELNIRKMTCGKIRIAAGLPLTWVSGQRDEFRDYLMQNKAVDFSFRNVSYHVEIVGVDVFPQGFAAVADRLSDFRGVNMICDIGNGTMNIMFINDKKPVSGNMFTEKYGTHQCLLAVRENVMRAHHTTVDEAIINRVFRFGTADIKEEYLKTITDTVTDYVEGIFQRLREHEYNPELMRLYVLGGGSCLIRNFGVYDASRVTINDDICATAKGYVDYFVTNNNAVSRGHADIITRGNRYFVRDLNSKNKTFINGQAIPAQYECEIFDGNRLTLGNEEFIFNSGLNIRIHQQMFSLLSTYSILNLKRKNTREPLTFQMFQSCRLVCLPLVRWF